MHDDGAVSFVGDSDGLVTKGIVAMLVNGLSGHTADEVPHSCPHSVILTLCATLTLTLTLILDPRYPQRPSPSHPSYDPLIKHLPFVSLCLAPSAVVVTTYYPMQLGGRGET
jgi:hypothetical protein